MLRVEFERFGELFLADFGSLVFAFIKLPDMPSTFATCRSMQLLAKQRTRELLATASLLTTTPFYLSVADIVNEMCIILTNSSGFTTEAFSTYMRIDPMGARCQKKLKRRELNFKRHQSVGDSGMSVLADVCVVTGALVNCKLLCLNASCIADSGMIFLADAIARGALPNLTALHLARNQIGKCGIAKFAEVLKSPLGPLASLVELDIGWNTIEDAGVRALGCACATPAVCQLTNLDLRFNKISEYGMSFLTDAIAHGALRSLVHFYLGGNYISDEGMMALSSTIATGALSSLEHLNLFDNRIGDKGMKSFVSAIDKGMLGKLTELDIRMNAISDPGMTSLRKAIADGNLLSLQTLDLFGNRFGKSAALALTGVCHPKGIIVRTK